MSVYMCSDVTDQEILPHGIAWRYAMRNTFRDE
jgi:hypothetical protein